MPQFDHGQLDTWFPWIHVASLLAASHKEMWPKVGLNGSKEPYSHFNLVCQCFDNIYFMDEMLILNDKISSLTWLLKGMCRSQKANWELPIIRTKTSSTFLHLQPGFRSIFAMSDWRIFFSSRIQWYLQDAALEGKIFTSEPMFFFWPQNKLLTKKMMDLKWYGRKRTKKTHYYTNNDSSWAIITSTQWLFWSFFAVA